MIQLGDQTRQSPSMDVYGTVLLFRELDTNAVRWKEIRHRTVYSEDMRELRLSIHDCAALPY